MEVITLKESAVLTVSLNYKKRTKCIIINVSLILGEQISKCLGGVNDGYVTMNFDASDGRL